MREGLDYHGQILVDKLTQIFILKEISERCKCFTLNFGIVVL